MATRQPAKKKKNPAKRTQTPSKAYTTKKYTKKGASYAAPTYTKKVGVFTKGGELAGGAIGSAFGPAGSMIGSFLGGKLGHLVGDITGFGDYRVSSNTIMTGGMRPAQMMNTTNRGGIIIRHREYLGDINASAAFAIQTLALNPGLDTTFPWLSQIAPAYEQYRWRGLIFEFNSTSSDSVLSAATSSALGSVMMATQYNALLPAFPDKRTLENYEFANSRKPSNSFIHPIECKAEVTPITKLYVRSGAITSGDLRLYDIGNFYIATQGMQASTGAAGELWATYEIEFYKPRFSVDAGSQSDHWHANAPTATFPLGTTIPTVAPGSNIGGIWTAGTTYNFPPNVVSGNYLWIYVMTGTVGAAINFNVPTRFNNVTCPCWLASAFNRIQAPVNGATSTTIMYAELITVTGPNATFTIPAGSTWPTGTLAADLFITNSPPALLTGKKKGPVLSWNDGKGIEEKVTESVKPEPEDIEELFSQLPLDMRLRLLSSLSSTTPTRKSL